MRREIDVALLTDDRLMSRPDRIVVAISMYADKDGWFSMSPNEFCHLLRFEYSNGDPDKETLRVYLSRLVKSKRIEREPIPGRRYSKFRVVTSGQADNRVALEMDSRKNAALLKKYIPQLPEIYISAHRYPLQFFAREGCEYLKDFANSASVKFWAKSFPSSVNKNVHLMALYPDERVRLQGAVLGLTDFYETVYLVGDSDLKQKHRQRLQEPEGAGRALNGLLKNYKGGDDRVRFLPAQNVMEMLATWDAGMHGEDGQPVRSVRATALALAKVRGVETTKPQKTSEPPKPTERDMWQGERASEADVGEYIQIHFPNTFEATCDAAFV